MITERCGALGLLEQVSVIRTRAHAELTVSLVQDPYLYVRFRVSPFTFSVARRCRIQLRRRWAIGPRT